MTAHSAIVHDTRRAKANGTFPVKLRITYQRQQKYFPTNIDLTKEQFSRLFSAKPRKDAKDMRDTLASIENKAKKIIEGLPDFSFKAFELKLHKRQAVSSVYQAYDDYIAILTKTGRIGTAESYNNSKRSLQAFKDTLRFEDIDVDFLRKYEDWMLADDKRSKTTVAIYLRSLRAIFNEAVEAGHASKSSYPFGKRKYQIPVSRNIKKALDMSDIGKIYNYEPDPLNIHERKAKDFWLLTYFANGINVKDIALLKYKNIHGDYLVFQRAKTERTSRSNPKQISIYISSDIKRIIEIWGTKPANPDNYLFPILDYGATPAEQRESIRNFTKSINKSMKSIAVEIGLGKVVTTYTARHSFSTVLKRSGASIDYISEALGHSNIRTTESYLDSFENETKKKFSESLTAFKNKKGEDSL